MDWLIWICVAVAVLGVFGAIWDSQDKAAARARTEGKLGSGVNFISRDGAQGISVSSSGTVTVASQYGSRTIAKADVISASVMKEGRTSIKSNRGSQLGRAVVGGALLGPLGAVAGAATGSKTQTEEITSITLRVLTRGSSPYEDIVFYSGSAKPESELTHELRAANNALSRILSAIG